MRKMEEFAAISPCEFADGMPRERFVDSAITCIWPQPHRIAGPAFTVECGPADHLMLHAAIYEANPGDVIVVKADPDFACSGGNVCAIAQERGIAGFVIDGVVRDVAEVRDIKFPVFARGVMPKPGAKNVFLPLNQPIDCGGVAVRAGDIVIADEEGIAIVPQEQAEEVYQIAKARTDKDAAMTLAQWQENHQTNVSKILERLQSDV